MVAFVLTVSLLPEKNLKGFTPPGGDKLHHFLAYGSMMAWFAQLYPRHRLWYALGFVAMGVAIEFIQPILSGRYFEWYDALANTVGVILGWIAMRSPLARSIAWADRCLHRS